MEPGEKQGDMDGGKSPSERMGEGWISAKKVFLASPADDPERKRNEKIIEMPQMDRDPWANGLSLRFGNQWLDDLQHTERHHFPR